MFLREKEKQAVPQASHVDTCKECAKLGPTDSKGIYRKSHEGFGYDKHEDMRKRRDDEHYAARKDTVESKREKSKHPSTSEISNSELAVSRFQTAQPIEKNGMLSNSLNRNTGLVEQNGTSFYERGFVPRTNPDKKTQRKNNMAHIEHWIKVQKGDKKRLDKLVVLLF